MITYDQVEKGALLYSPIPGVHWQATEAVIMDKQPPNAITIREVGNGIVHVVGREWFDSAGFEPVTDELMAKEPPR